MNRNIIVLFIAVLPIINCLELSAQNPEIRNDSPNVWEVDFFDDFDTFNSENWQDQRIWVNNETQCYVPDGKYGTREVSNGTLKIKVINVGEEIVCDNYDKHGNQHPNTPYVAGRIASKNKRNLLRGNGQPD